jgi:hypothetical protein
MRKSSKLIIGLALATLLLPSQASADPTVEITSMTATPNANGISVVVRPNVTGATTEVATDDSDTATANVPGVDLKSASITPLSATMLRFTINLNNGISPGDLWGVPEVYHYQWDILVTQGTTTSESTLQALRTSQYHGAGTTEPAFNVNTCVTNETTGQGECTGTPVTGSFADNAIDIDVPLATLAAKPGAILSQGDASIVSTVGVSGLVWFTNLGGDQMTNLADYTIPAPTVSVGVAPAGTPDEDVAQTTTATANSTFKTFTAQLAPQTSGTHRIVAKGCYQDACTLAGIDYVVP